MCESLSHDGKNKTNWIGQSGKTERSEVTVCLVPIENTSGGSQPRRLGIYIGFSPGDSDLLEIPTSVRVPLFSFLCVLRFILCCGIVFLTNHEAREHSTVTSVCRTP